MQGFDRCWCCGSSFPEEHVVRLGQHPEVAVCLDCALFLHRRATQRRDESNPSLAGRVRSGLQACRDWVVARGWHAHGRFGSFLRWLDRHLP
jgi:ribosome-binding protein aMBF1 (putative translation factor)